MLGSKTGSCRVRPSKTLDQVHTIQMPKSSKVLLNMFFWNWWILVCLRYINWNQTSSYRSLSIILLFLLSKVFIQVWLLSHGTIQRKLPVILSLVRRSLYIEHGPSQTSAGRKSIARVEELYLFQILPTIHIQRKIETRYPIAQSSAVNATNAFWIYTSLRSTRTSKGGAYYKGAPSMCCMWTILKQEDGIRNSAYL